MHTVCGVYNGSELISQIPVWRAFVLWLKGRVEIVQTYSDTELRTASRSYPAPQAVVLTPYRHNIKRFSKYAPQLKQHALFLRDDYTCQYCGRHVSELNLNEGLTRDHIVPRSRGGLDVWTNVCAACSSCNRKKADRTPKEADMMLRRSPHVPTRGELNAKRSQRKKTLN